MDVRVDIDIPCGPSAIYPFVCDLVQYPQWMGLVHSAVLDPTTTGPTAWIVELRGKIGPFARSKRLRMQQVVTDSPHHVRFERSEDDGQQHGQWVLEVKIADLGTELVPKSSLKMTLHYGGRLFSSVVERALQDEIEMSKKRLLHLVMSA